MFSIKKIISFFILSASFFTFAFAQDIDTELTTEATVVNVGDTVEVKLHVYPPSDTEPLYTVSATALYDTELLSYLGSRFATINWFPLNRPPYVLEDTTQGMIRKTAGYPKGLKNDSDFIVYTFKAINAGVATISLEDGLGLDSYNNETKVALRKIYIKILPPPKPVVAEATTTATTTQETLPKVVNVNLKVAGDTAFYRQEDYEMTIDQMSLASGTVATTYVQVYDQDYNIVWQKDLTYSSDEETESLKFIIPAFTLKPGDYVVSVKSLLSDGTVQVLDEKYIGVLDNGSGILGPYRTLFWACFFFVVFVAILHHMMLDQEVIDEENSLRMQLRKFLRRKKS